MREKNDVCGNCALAEGKAAAERMREKTENTPYCAEDGTPIPLTMSFGCTACTVGGDVNACIDIADKALYTAKNSGRNRVVDLPAA